MDLRGPVARDGVPSPLVQRLRTLREEITALGSPRALRRARETRHILRGEDVLVELHLAPGMDPAGVDLTPLQSLEYHLHARTPHTLEVWVRANRLDALEEVLDEWPSVRSADVPQGPRQTLGGTLSEGYGLIGADEAECAGVDGTGINVANVDITFGEFDQSQSSGDIGAVSSTPSSTGSTHGTSTSEIIFDVAPGITLRPVPVTTLSELESFATTVESLDIDVVSHSLSWAGYSFGDGTGRLCDVADSIAAQGAVLVTSAGNDGINSHYRGTFTDVDDDDVHEFGPNDELNEFVLPTAGTLDVYVDWDAYPLTDIDYDLTVYKFNGSGWDVVGTSTRGQSGAGSPWEEVVLGGQDAGAYAFSIEKLGSVTALVDVRAFIFVNGDPQIQYGQDAGSLIDPASCESALTVGGVGVSNWVPDGALYVESSIGPTTDGREKPDIVAPTGVSTRSIDPFWGTSSSTPHVAGALALYLEGGAADTAAAVQQLLVDADGQDPSASFGAGRVNIPPARVGAICSPGQVQSCTTGCGSTGMQTCDGMCDWGSCVPPAEMCNGLDDDCNDGADEDFDCVQSESVDCTTSCGSTGSRSCGLSCTLGVCAPPAEMCNALDDDCDGTADNGFECVRTVSRDCTTSCGSMGQQVCGDACTWLECAPPDEVCNGVDDNCDGTIDEGLDCPPGPGPEGGTGGCSSVPRASWPLWAVVALYWRLRRSRS